MGIQSANFMAGQIEICTGGEWRAVCHSSWDVNDAMVVCRQLGFPSEGKRTAHANLGPLEVY